MTEQIWGRCSNCDATQRSARMVGDPPICETCVAVREELRTLGPHLWAGELLVELQWSSQRDGQCPFCLRDGYFDKTHAEDCKLKAALEGEK